MDEEQEKLVIFTSSVQTMDGFAYLLNDEDEEEGSLLDSSSNNYSSSARRGEDSYPSLQEELADAEARYSISTEEMELPLSDSAEHIQIEQSLINNLNIDNIQQCPMTFEQSPMTVDDIEQLPLPVEETIDDKSEGCSNSSGKSVSFELENEEFGYDVFNQLNDDVEVETVLPRKASPRDHAPYLKKDPENLYSIEKIATLDNLLDDSIFVDDCDLQDSLTYIISKTIKEKRNMDVHDVTLIKKDVELSKIWPGNVTNFNFRIGYREHMTSPQDDIHFPHNDALSDHDDHQIENRSHNIDSDCSRSSGVISITNIFSQLDKVQRSGSPTDVIKIVDNLTNALVYLVEVNKELKRSKPDTTRRFILSDSPASSDKLTSRSEGSQSFSHRLQTRDTEYLRCLRICGRSYCSGKCRKGKSVDRSRCDKTSSRRSYHSQESTQLSGSPTANSLQQYDDRIRDLAIRRRRTSLQQSDDEIILRQSPRRYTNLPSRPESVNIEDQIKDCIDISNSLESLLTGGPPLLKSSRSLSKSMPNISHSYKHRLEFDNNNSNKDFSNPSLSTIESITSQRDNIPDISQDPMIPTTSVDPSQYIPPGFSGNASVTQEDSISFKYYNDSFNPAAAKLKEVIRIEKELEDCVKLSLSLEELIVDYVEKNVQPLSTRSCSLPDVRGEANNYRRKRHVSETIQAGDKWHSDSITNTLRQRNSRAEYYTDTSTDSYHNDRPRSHLRKSEIIMNLNLSTSGLSSSDDSIDYRRTDFYKLDFAKDKPSSRRYVEPSKVVRFSKLETTDSEYSEEEEHQIISTPSVTPDTQLSLTPEQSPTITITIVRESSRTPSLPGSISPRSLTRSANFQRHDTPVLDESEGDSDDSFIDHGEESSEEESSEYSDDEISDVEHYQPLPNRQNVPNCLRDRLEPEEGENDEENSEKISSDSSDCSEDNEVGGFDTSYIVDSQDECRKWKKPVAQVAEVQTDFPLLDNDNISIHDIAMDLIYDEEPNSRLVNAQTSPVNFPLEAEQINDYDNDESSRLEKSFHDESSAIDKITLTSSYSQTEASEPLFKPDPTFTSSYSQTDSVILEPLNEHESKPHRKEIEIQTDEFCQTSDVETYSEPSKDAAESYQNPPENHCVHVIHNNKNKKLTKSKIFSSSTSDMKQLENSQQCSLCTPSLRSDNVNLVHEDMSEDQLQYSEQSSSVCSDKRGVIYSANAKERDCRSESLDTDFSQQAMSDRSDVISSVSEPRQSSEHQAKVYRDRRSGKGKRKPSSKPKQQRPNNIEQPRSDEHPTISNPNKFNNHRDSYDHHHLRFHKNCKSAPNPRNYISSSTNTFTSSTQSMREEGVGVSTTVPTMTITNDVQPVKCRIIPIRIPFKTCSFPNDKQQPIIHQPLMCRRHVDRVETKYTHCTPCIHEITVSSDTWRYRSTSSRLMNDPDRCPVMVNVPSMSGSSEFPIHIKKKKVMKNYKKQGQSVTSSEKSGPSLREYKMAQFIPEEIEDDPTIPSNYPLLTCFAAPRHAQNEKQQNFTEEISYLIPNEELYRKEKLPQNSFKEGYDFLNNYHPDMIPLQETENDSHGISQDKKNVLMNLFKEVGISEKRCLKLIKRLS